MRAVPTAIPDVLILEPVVHPDQRGYFLESYNRARMQEIGLDLDFVQDNLARSWRGVLRGLHFQVTQPQGKLVRALRGEIYDVAVDLRPGSPSFGRWVGVVLNGEDHRSLWIPPGFAHGYCVLSAEADVHYKVTAPWVPEGERVLRWDDPAVGVAWPLQGPPILSARDQRGASLAELGLSPSGTP